MVMPTAAASADQVQQSLESVLKDFPSGSYFTTDGNKGSPNELTKIMKARGLNATGYGISYTCVGFAKYVWAKVFGHDITSYREEYSSGRAGVQSTWENAMVGDLVYFYKNSDMKIHKTETAGFVKDPYIHAAIIWAISDSGITLYDCNYKGTNQIGLYTVTFGGRGWPKSYCRLYHSTNYDEINSSVSDDDPPITTPTYPSMITFDSLTTPGNLPVGSGGHIDGSISSSNSPICSVKAEICDSAGKVYLTATSDGFSVSTYGPLKNSKIDSGLTFGKLPAGTYYIKYTVTTADGTSATSNTEIFNVGDAPHTTHEKGASAYCGNEHPHYNYYTCSICGEAFTDGSTTVNRSCGQCWGPWSDWSTTPVTPSDTREVETRQTTVSDGHTEYRYGRYVDSTGKHDCWCSKYLEGLSYVSGSAILQYSDWSTTQYSANSKGWSCGYCSGNHTGVHHYGADGRAWWAEYVLPTGSYYWEETQWVDTSYTVTEYRYRDLL